MGFGQGTGQALNIGKVFSTFGFTEGKEFGLAIAAIGFLVACIVGVIYLNVLKRKGKLTVQQASIDSNTLDEHIFEEDEAPLSESVDKLTIQNLKLDVYANQSAIHSKKEITLDKVSGEIYSVYQDGIYVSDIFNRVNIFNCNLLIESYGKGITVNSSVVYFENSFVEIKSEDGYALWDTDRSAIAYVSYPDKHFVFAGWYEDEAEEVEIVLDREYKSCRFLGTKGTLSGNKVTLESIPPFGFAAVEVF